MEQGPVRWLQQAQARGGNGWRSRRPVRAGPDRAGPTSASESGCSSGQGGCVFLRGNVIMSPEGAVICSSAMLFLFFPSILSFPPSTHWHTHVCDPPCLRGGQGLSQPSCCSSSLRAVSVSSERLITPKLCLIRQHLRLIARAFLYPPTVINAEKPIW